MSHETDLVSRLGVLMYDSTVDIDRVVACAIEALRRYGLSVGGILQHFGDRLSNGKRSMWVTDIASGRQIRLDRPRGSGAMACMPILTPWRGPPACCGIR